MIQLFFVQKCNPVHFVDLGESYHFFTFMVNCHTKKASVQNFAHTKFSNTTTVLYLVTFYNSKLVPVKNVPNYIAIYDGTRFHVFRPKHACTTAVDLQL